MVTYCNPVFDGNNLVSVDNIRLDLKFSPANLDKMIHKLNDLTMKYMVTCNTCFKDFAYKYLYVFGIDGLSFSLGLCLNGYSSKDVQKGFFDFNPNKVLQNVVFQDGVFSAGFEYAKRNIPFTCEGFNKWSIVYEMFCDVYYWVMKYADVSIKRYDLAVDVPVVRDKLQLIKDNRKYTQVFKSSLDYTEYLGVGSNSGRVKVYNKTIESALDYDLTRIELTSEHLDYDKMIKQFPKIRLIDVELKNASSLLFQLLEIVPSVERVRFLSQVDRSTKYRYLKLFEDNYLIVSENVFDKVKSNMFDLVFHFSG